MRNRKLAVRIVGNGRKQHLISLECSARRQVGREQRCVEDETKETSRASGSRVGSAQDRKLSIFLGRAQLLGSGTTWLVGTLPRSSHTVHVRLALRADGLAAPAAESQGHEAQSPGMCTEIFFFFPSGSTNFLFQQDLVSSTARAWSTDWRGALRCPQIRPMNGSRCIKRQSPRAMTGRK